MRTFIYSLMLCLGSLFTSYAQNQLEELHKEGRVYRDQGNYDKAIESYQKILNLNPQSSLANYEISLNYMYKGTYDLAIKYSQIIIDQGGRLVVPAIVVKASSLNNLNRVDEAIVLLEDAVENLNADVMVYYNLAVCYLKVKNIDKAQQALIAGIYENPMHASSHYMLATLQADRGNRIESMLSGYFFLLLETKTARTLKMEQLIKNLYTQGGTVVEGANKKKKNSTISLDRNRMESPLSAVELGLRMMAANANTAKKGETFFKDTTTFLGLIDKVILANDVVVEDIAMCFYIPFFQELYETKQGDVFCNYISQMKPGGNRKWIDQHIEKVRAFEQWVVDKSRKLIGIDVS